MSRRWPACNIGILSTLLIPALLFGQSPPPSDEPRLPVPDPRVPTPQPMYDGKPAEGPLTPGPLPEMPGYFTRKAERLNYRQTPFFNRGNGYGYSGGGDPGYYPGVYPYYDAQAHYRQYKEYERERQLIETNRSMKADGLEFFRDGDFENAAVKFLGAAEQHHGDAASRLFAGHALFALGRYNDAHALLRRAFELSPSLAYARFDPRSDYGDPSLFDRQLRSLRKYAGQHPEDASAAAVSGYMIFYAEGMTPALPLLEHAATLIPEDTLVKRLLAVAGKASWNRETLGDSVAADRRPYDQMGIRSNVRLPYDQLRRVSGSDRAGEPLYRAYGTQAGGYGAPENGAPRGGMDSYDRPEEDDRCTPPPNDDSDLRRPGRSPWKRI